MKKLKAAVCVLLALLTLPPIAAVAAEAEPAALDGVYAVLTLEDGEIITDEAPDAEEMSEIESYELFIAEQSVLSVEQVSGLSDAPAQIRSYYSADFTIPGTTYDVFLTGLTPDNIESVQRAMINSFAKGKTFNLTDLDFIDAEKTYSNDADDQLCWAASASDMLEFTGWASKAGFDNEDEVFEAYIAAHENDGSNQAKAMAWFFNGSAGGDNTGGSGAEIIDYPNSGGYLKDYAYEQFSGHNYVEGGTYDMDMIVDLLRSGCGVGLAIMIYKKRLLSYRAQGAHAITVWGAVTDSSRPSTDPARYLSLFITDSDSYESKSTNRYNASNVINVFPLVYDTRASRYDMSSNIGYTPDGCWCFDYDSSNRAVMLYHVYLYPYSDSCEVETYPDATRDKANYPDLSLLETYLYDKGSLMTSDLFETGTDVCFKCLAVNAADVSYKGAMYIYFTITDSSGEKVYSQGFNYNSATVKRPGSQFSTKQLTAEGLADGDYTINYTINHVPAYYHPVQEAYYYNNVKSIDFKVRDSYLCGDINSNGSVDIMDATQIQRYLAGYDDEPDVRTAERGDSNRSGLDIMDATAIRRWLADLDTASPIGAKKLYD